MVFNRSESEAGARRIILHRSIHLNLTGLHALIGRKLSQQKIYDLQCLNLGLRGLSPKGKVYSIGLIVYEAACCLKNRAMP